MRKILEAFFRRKTAIVLIAVITSGLIVFGTFCRTPQYMSETRFMIPIGRELGATTSNVRVQATMLMMDYADQIATQMEVLKNRRLVEDALSRMSPEILNDELPSAPVMQVVKLLRGRLLGGGESGDGPTGTIVEKPHRTFREWLLRHGLMHELTDEEALVRVLERFSPGQTVRLRVYRFQTGREAEVKAVLYAA